MLRKKRLYSLVLILVLILTAVAGSVPTASAKKGDFYANKTSIKIQTKGKVVITSSNGGALSYKIGNSKICSASWGKWKGNNIPLTVKAKSYGKTTVKVTNKKSKKTIKITVNVRTVDLKLPKTPFYIKNFDWDGEQSEEVKITKVWAEVKYYGSYDIDPSIRLFVKGVKTYSEEYNTSTSVWVPWKVYGSGNVVKDSGQILTTDIETGEGFESYSYVSVAPGKYSVKFLNHTY